jgi:hypothetical protein
VTLNVHQINHVDSRDLLDYLGRIVFATSTRDFHIDVKGSVALAPRVPTKLAGYVNRRIVALSGICRHPPHGTHDGRDDER